MWGESPCFQDRAKARSWDGPLTWPQHRRSRELSMPTFAYTQAFKVQTEGGGEPSGALSRAHRGAPGKQKAKVSFALRAHTPQLCPARPWPPDRATWRTPTRKGCRMFRASSPMAPEGKRTLFFILLLPSCLPLTKSIHKHWLNAHWDSCLRRPFQFHIL